MLLAILRVGGVHDGGLQVFCLIDPSAAGTFCPKTSAARIGWLQVPRAPGLELVANCLWFGSASRYDNMDMIGSRVDGVQLPVAYFAMPCDCLHHDISSTAGQKERCFL